jgi:hypothetical protein
VSISAVSCQQVIYQLPSSGLVTTVSIDTDIYGMAVRGSTIYYCAENNGLKMLNLSDRTVSDIINSNISGVYYVATSSNRKAVVLLFTTNNLLVDMSYSSTRGFFRPSLEDNSCL